MKNLKVLAAAALIAGSVFTVQGEALAAAPNSIEVRGIATREVAPDMANITLGITVKADTAEEARAQAAEITKNAKRALLGLAISQSDIKTSSYNLYPNYEYVNNKNRQKGYSLSTTMQVKVDDLNKLGDVIDKTVKEGITEVNQINFGLKNESSIQRQLLAAAVDNARAKAEIVASAGGRSIGEMLSADISDYSGETVMQRNVSYAKGALASDGAPTQLSEGTLKITGSVNVAFKLN